MSSYEEQRLTFACFTEPLDVQQFTAWPQHMVLFPPVKAAPIVGRSVAELTAESAYEFEVTVDGQADLEGQTAHLLEPRSALITALLHRRIMDGLLANRVNLEGVNHIDDDYLPHISQKHGQTQLETGDKRWVDHIALLVRQLDNSGDPTGPQVVNKVFRLKSHGR